MAARQSAEVRHAMDLVTKGKTIYQAAAATGIWPSTLYRALNPKVKPKVKKKVKKALAKRVA